MRYIIVLILALTSFSAFGKSEEYCRQFAAMYGDSIRLYLNGTRGYEFNRAVEYEVRDHMGKFIIEPKEERIRGATHDMVKSIRTSNLHTLRSTLMLGPYNLISDHCLNDM